MAQQELASARQRLVLVDGQATRYLSRFKAMRTQVAQIAATAYENGSLTSPAVLLTSGSAQQILDQASILQELSSSNSNQMKQFVSAARQLAGAQSRRPAAPGTRKPRCGATLASEKSSVERRWPKRRHCWRSSPRCSKRPPAPASRLARRARLARLAARARCDQHPGGEGGSRSAYAQLGKPYVFGAAGPDSYDCSGLTQSAWAAAGVSIPRTSFDQWGSLPHVSMSPSSQGTSWCSMARGMSPSTWGTTC